MRYFITAIETATGFKHEEEVENVDKTVSDLEVQGYSNIVISERWSSLDEMFESCEKEGLYDRV